MKFTVAVMALAGITALGAFSTGSTVSAQGAKTQWSGVYTEDQAKAGDPLYVQYCASCRSPFVNVKVKRPRLPWRSGSVNVRRPPVNGSSRSGGMTCSMDSCAGRGLSGIG